MCLEAGRPPRTINLIVASCFVVSLLAVGAGQAHARSVATPDWSFSIRMSPFIGIVECTTAGINIGRYRVVENWKGPHEPGDSITIWIPGDSWDPSHLATVGSRWIIVANHRGESFLPRPESLGTIPWCRRTYNANYVQRAAAPARQRLPEDVKADFQLHFVVSPAEEFGMFKRRVAHYVRLAAANPDIAESACTIAAHVWDWMALDATNEYERRLKELLDASPKYDEVIDALVHLVAYSDEKYGNGVALVMKDIVYRNHEEAIAYLRMLDSDRVPGVFALEPHLAWAKERAEKTRANQEVKRASSRYSDSVLRLWRDEILTSAKIPVNQHHRLEAVAGSYPDEVADWLHQYMEQEQWDGYFSINTFAAGCREDRTDHFTKLLSARDPWVRVGAGVYLAYEDEAAGVRALKELTELPEGPGIWAALTLARRGHKDYMLQALRALEPILPRHPFDRSPKSAAKGPIFAERVLVLLDNSIAASGMPRSIIDEIQTFPTELEFHEEDRFQIEQVLAWWADHEAEITLRDPWLSILSQQKVD